MWELIRANRRRSVVLLLAMLVLLLTLGFFIGAAVFGAASEQRYVASDGMSYARIVFNPAGGLIGVGIAFVLWSLQAGLAFFQGDRILLGMAGAREIQKADAPQLYNVVEEMTIAASLPKMPRVYIINDMGMNAFAAGRKPENAVVAVTAGLLGALNRDQLQGVIAHEIAHIKNRDVLFMTMVIVMVGSVVMLSEIFLRGLWHTGGRYGGGNKRDNGGAAVMLIVALILAILAPILAHIIYFAVSRRREYLADAGAAVFTRYPEGLAQALEAISVNAGGKSLHRKSTAPLYIVNPLESEKRNLTGLFSTHPPTQERIKILRGLAGGVSYAKYQDVYGQVHGGRIIPDSGLHEAEAPLRGAAAPGAAEDPRQRMREAGDLLRGLNGFMFLPCACGMKIKLPPDFRRETINCPRCSRTLQVPAAELTALEAVGERMAQQAPPPIPLARPRPPRQPSAEPPLAVRRDTAGWQSVKCSCGAIKNIPPSVRQGETNCTRCGRRILVSDS